MSAIEHPQRREDGRTVWIQNPSTPSAAATWHDPGSVAVWTPDSPVPTELNGLPIGPWQDFPASLQAWNENEGQLSSMKEPPLTIPDGMFAASGCVIVEPDGRFWIVAPTNEFAGAIHTIPKGRLDDGLSLQANAIKETFEESGLKVEITSFLCDVKRSQSMTRYYLARRTGGSPAEMGWESQAVLLAPGARLKDLMNKETDQQVIEYL